MLILCAKVMMTFAFSFHTFDSDKDKTDDATVEEEDEGEEEFWNGRHTSTPNTPSPVKTTAPIVKTSLSSNGPLSHILKQATPEREKSMPTLHSSVDKLIGDNSTIKEEEESELNGNGNDAAAVVGVVSSPPVSAGAVIINVLSSPSGSSSQEEAADNRTNSVTPATAPATATAASAPDPGGVEQVS